MNQHPQGGAWDSCAAEASALVFGARGTVYSHPHDDYGSVIEIHEAICPDHLLGTIEGAIYQMIAVKLARLRFGLEQSFTPDVLRDHVVDACGYLDCLFGAIVREYELATDETLADIADDFDA